MEANTIPVLEFLGATKRIFNIPVYQRSYSWKQEQCKKLFDDLLNIKLQNKLLHFIGTIVYVDVKASPSFKEFIIIDGQQRITTILLLLKALHDEAKDEDFKEDLYNNYLINNGKKIEEKHRVKLKTVANDSNIFEKLISEENVEEIGKGSKILENYKYFRQRIVESRLSEEEINNLIEKLTMVYIMLDNEKEDPQLIFESLNSTGLDLTHTDLIRNYLLMGHSREKQEKLYNKYWESIEKKIPFSEITDFIRDYLTMKSNVIPNKNRIYETFKEFYEKNIKNFISIEEFLLELDKYAKYHCWLKNFNSNYEKLNLAFEEFARLKNSVINPFMFYMLNKFENNEIDLKEVIEACNIIQTYIFRRAVCNIQTNALNKIFASLPKEVENNKLPNSKFSQTVLFVLLSKTSTGIFPRDTQFKESLTSRDMYSFKQCKYLLRKFISYGTKENIETNSLTIEHIMPQTLNSKWRVDLGSKYNEIFEKNLHLLGNLTLSGYNSEISNRAFFEKKEFYKTSNIGLNRELVNYEIWNEVSITERGKKLAELACKIWAIPQLSEEFSSKAILRKEEYDIFDEVDVTNTKPIGLSIMGQNISVSSWRQFFIKLSKEICDLDEEKFYTFTTHPDFKGKEKRIIANTDVGMRSPMGIRNNIFIETNLNANDILNYSKLIMEKYEAENIDVSFKIQ